MNTEYSILNELFSYTYFEMTRRKSKKMTLVEFDQLEEAYELDHLGKKGIRREY